MVHVQYTMGSFPWFFALLASSQVQAVDTSWHAPDSTIINNLDQALDGKGSYGFIYDTSNTPERDYGRYNWCNMPHVRKTEYPRASNEYELQYVEVVCLIIN